MNKLIIIGASGHGKVAAEIALLNGYKDIFFLDDDSTKSDCLNFSVIGGCKDFLSYTYCDFFVAIGNPEIRESFFRSLTINNINIVNLIHPKSNISKFVNMGKGIIIMGGATINPGTIIQNGVIINTNSSIDHDNFIGDFVHIAVGAHTCGNVKIHRKTWVGAGAIISNNISITNNCIIGAGCVVINDITSSGTYAGVPAKKIK